MKRNQSFNIIIVCIIVIVLIIIVGAPKLEWHYKIMIPIIIAIFCYQLHIFLSNLKEMRDFKNVFPDNKKLENDIQKIENDYQRKIQEIKNATDAQLENLLRKRGAKVEDYYKINSNYYPPMGGVEYRPWENQEVRIFETAKAQSFLISSALKEKNDTIAKLRLSFKNSQNQIFTTIENSIDDYVKANKEGISDFHLMKDIVDRNCDAKEEEIQTQIPVPLYYGLAGTMFGILVGVGFLVGTDGLKALLSSDIPNTFKALFPEGSENEIKNAWAAKGSDGVIALLGGVALAMISSITGIILTTIGSSIFKKSKKILENNKHGYLSWIQKELLPTLSTDVSASLIKVSQSLLKFNTEFSKNTTHFNNAIISVKQASENVTKTLTILQRLDMQRIASANIEVYEKLKNCTDEIGTLARYLNNSNQYLANVRALNDKLDGYEKRTQIIEDAGKFFAKNEKFLSENFDNATIETQNALKRFNENMEVSLKKLQESLNGKILIFNDVMEQQQSLLIGKTKEIDKIVEELKNLSDIKKGISGFEKAIIGQNAKIDKLTSAIYELAKQKSGNIKLPLSHRLSRWFSNLSNTNKIILIIGSAILLGGLILCIYIIIK